MKRCPKCKTDKPVEAFSKSSTRPDGRQGHCKACRAAQRLGNADHYRNFELMRNYGITLDHYNELLARQGGACAICHENKDVRNLAVDHCHETGKVRGILCQRCNRALGLLRDDTSLMRSAIMYLDTPREV